MPIGAFFEDHRGTSLSQGEILVEVLVPPRGPGEGAAYQAFGLRAANFVTVAGVAAWIRLEAGRCAAARVALGAVAPTPLLAREAGESLAGTRLEETAIGAAAALARQAAQPISDLRGSEHHRRELVEVLCSRALRAAGGRAS
jgi:carbon-monoxide dehydrogenase medium subunit